MIETRTDFTRLQASVEATMTRARELRAASLVLQQRLSATQRELAEVSDQTQSILKTVRQHIASLHTVLIDQNKSKPEPSNAVLEVMSLLRRDENDLDEMIDDLSAAFKSAIAVGDDDGRALFGNALMQIGRHLAAQLGPRTAGVIMN